MKPETTETLKPGRSAKPRAIVLAVLIVLVLAVILAWLLGFFTWLLS
jgi:hypothetical protein